VMSWTGRASAVRTVDPYEDWQTKHMGALTLHANRTAPDETLAVIGLVCSRAEARVEALTGIPIGAKPADGTGGPAVGRIECYLYPSLEEKLRVTDNQELAHRVEWANAVHLAWADGSESAFTRELLKLVDAQVHGKLYTPLIRDGLAVCAGRNWAGRPVREESRDLLNRGFLPDLDVLVDAVQFVHLDEKLSQPAAGSLICYLVDERGEAVARQLYERAAGRSVEAGPLLETVLDDSLGAIERRWHTYLRPGWTGAAGAQEPPDGER